MDIAEQMACVLDGDHVDHGFTLGAVEAGEHRRMADLLLATEVSPGVTLGDAVSAYLALERQARPYGIRFGRSDGSTWVFMGAATSDGPTLAAAILAAAEAPDAGENAP